MVVNSDHKTQKRMLHPLYQWPQQSEDSLPPVFRKYPKSFHDRLLTQYPCYPSPVQVTTKKRTKKIQDCCPAYYIYNAYEHLVSYDCDGKKITSQMVESPPSQCIVLSNGTVAMTSETATYGNIVVETIEKTGEKQTISLPQQEQGDLKFSLLEFPKNHVCVYHHDHFFFFDPLNPFTTHKSIKIESSSFQQLDGKLYLWSNDENNGKWCVLDGANTELVWKSMPETCDRPIEGTPVWVSPTEFVHYSRQIVSRVRNVCVYDTTNQKCEALPLKSYCDGQLGEVYFVVDGCRVLISQWPSWDEQSSQVRMTVFCTRTSSILYENLTWYNNQRVGLAPMKTIIGGFQWPYLQTNMMSGPEVQIFNLETNKLLCSHQTNILNQVVKTTFVGDLAIVQTGQEYDVLKLSKDTNRSLKFRSGQLFRHEFLVEVPVVPELKLVVTPAEEVKVEPPKSETVVVIEPKMEVEPTKEEKKSEPAQPQPPTPVTAPTDPGASTCTIC